MAGEATVHLTQTAYHGLLAHIEDLEDRLAALEADDGSRIPHTVALAIIRGESPLVSPSAPTADSPYASFPVELESPPATSPKSNAAANPAPPQPSPKSPPPSTPPSIPC